MPAPRSRRRARLSALVSVALAFTGFQVFLAPRPQARRHRARHQRGLRRRRQRRRDVEERLRGAETPAPRPCRSTACRCSTAREVASTRQASATSTSSRTCSVPAGGTFLVKEADGTGGTKALPTPDCHRRPRHERHGWPDLPGGLDHPPRPERADRDRRLHVRTRASSTSWAGAPPRRPAEGVRAPATTEHHVDHPYQRRRHRQQLRRLHRWRTDSTNAAGETEPPTATALTATFPGNKTAIKDSPITSFTIGATGGTPPLSLDRERPAGRPHHLRRRGNLRHPDRQPVPSP